MPKPLAEQIGLFRLKPVPAAAFTNIPESLLLCECGKRSVRVGAHDNFLLVKCVDVTCTRQWLLCMACRNQRSRLDSIAKRKRHTNNCHVAKGRKKKALMARPVDTTQETNLLPALEHATVQQEDPPLFLDGSDDDNDGDNTLPFQDDTLEGIEWQEVVNPQNLGFSDMSNQSNQLYFQQCFMTASELGGMEYLVKKVHLEQSCIKMNTRK